MHKELGPLLGNLPPKTAQALTQAINCPFQEDKSSM
jgi:hypothetical protein